jgi:hypothetical protein
MENTNKLEALNVQTNVHIALQLLHGGMSRVVDRFRAYRDVDGTVTSYNDSFVQRTLHINRWHSNLQNRFRLHPAVDKLLGDYRPLDWQQLVMEYPHQAESDRNRVAYTQNEKKGEVDLQTVTSLGKYLTRHFPQLPDHEVRNAVAAYSVTGCKIVWTLAEMVDVLQRGPHSCMRWNEGGKVDIDSHPYRCYDPLLGWGMAMREEGGEVVGRALVYDKGDMKLFVRTYLRPSQSSSYSQADDQLNAWLKEQGYSHAGSWEDCEMAYYGGRNDTPVAPYLDGNVKNVNIITRDFKKVLVVTDGGEYRCENTDGTCASDNGSTCEDCGDRVDDGDEYWTGRDGDYMVCQSCCDHNYMYVTGRRGNNYHLHESQAVLVGDEHYDEDYLGDNDIVQLENGDYCTMDDAVHVESDGEYYHCDDERVCYDDYNYQYAMRDDLVELVDGSMCHADDAWQCCATSGWYSDNDSDDRVEIEGELFHKDYVPVTDDEETTTQGE